MQATASSPQRSDPTQGHDGWCVILCGQGLTKGPLYSAGDGVVFPQASARRMMLSVEGGGITQASCKHAGCQCDSRSNYGIIHCKLLGDNNNKSGLTPCFENLGLTNLPVVC